MTNEEKKQLVKYRIDRAKETLSIPTENNITKPDIFIDDRQKFIRTDVLAAQYATDVGNGELYFARRMIFDVIDDFIFIHKECGCMIKIGYWYVSLKLSFVMNGMREGHDRG